MEAASISITTSRHSIWLVGVSFVLFQFFMQLSSGVIIGSIMEDMDLSAFTAGLLGSSLYIVYTALQIPVGIFFDTKNTRTLLFANALLCSIGCLLFAFSHSLTGLFLSRLLIGTGSAFAFVGLSHLLRQYYPLQKFAFMIGLSETLGFFVTVLAMIGLSELLAHWGWRNFITLAGFLGLLISLLCLKVIPNTKPPSQIHHYKIQVIQILRNKSAWINGLFVGLSFTIVTVFGALWAVPFLQIKLGCSLKEATVLGSMFFLGAGISCPLFGWLASHFKRRKPLILTSCVTTLVLYLMVLFLPIENALWMGILLCSTGVCCGAYMLAYTIANELSPPDSLSMSTGFTNTLAMLTAPLLQPFTGYLLDLISQNHSYTARHFQLSLLTVAAALILAGVLVLFLPEKPAAQN